MSPASPVYLLDSFALLAYLNDEPGKGRVQELLALAADRKCRLLLCLVNLGEALHITERSRGLPLAQSVLALVESLPLELLDATRDLVLDAAHLKAHYAVSYAAAFAVAAALREGATVLTGDPEFAAVARLINVEWLGEQ